MIANPDGLDSPAMRISDVFITTELKTRVRKKRNHLKEKLAFQDLASHMSDEPEEILPRFVDLGMDMAGGSSAGISLYEEHPSPGIFRWRHVRGAFKTFDGATTPRNFSPCGVTLDENGPVLSTYPERVYDWIAAANIVVPEVLLVPLYLSGSQPLGTLWIVSDEIGHFDGGHARMATDLARFAGVALRVAQTERSLQQALADQQILTHEMSHRVKNLFAVTEGLIRISAKGANTKEQMARDLSGRLRALADAHALVRCSLGEPAANARARDLRTLICAILRPHDAAAGHPGARFSIDGPPMDCNEQIRTGLALALHELATNAAKYGALQTEQGHVEVSWTLESGRLIMSWIERGGPRIEAPPAAAGFGSALVRRIIVQQLGGRLNSDWQPSGLATTIILPIGSN